MRKWQRWCLQYISSEDEQTNSSKAASASSCALLETFALILKAKNRPVLKRPSKPTVDNLPGCREWTRACLNICVKLGAGTPNNSATGPWQSRFLPLEEASLCLGLGNEQMTHPADSTENAGQWVGVLEIRLLPASICELPLGGQ